MRVTWMRCPDKQTICVQSNGFFNGLVGGGWTEEWNGVGLAYCYVLASFFRIHIQQMVNVKGGIQSFLSRPSGHPPPTGTLKSPSLCYQAAGWSGTYYDISPSILLPRAGGA